jgi:hypothetical protein
MPAGQPRSAPTRALVLLAPVLLASCMLGPDFKRPVVPWLDGWSADALQSAEAESQEVGRPPLQHEEWWPNFDDLAIITTYPVLRLSGPPAGAGCPAAYSVTPTSRAQK